ncbi:MAG TPA: hypothetical protein VII66_01975 [Gemmatimonadaceae bacterium]
MMLQLRVANLTAAGILSATILSACSGAYDPMQPDFTGTYRVSDSRHAVSCSPNALPAPQLADQSQYAQMSGDSAYSLLQVQQSGTGLSIAPLDATGHAVSSQTLRGTIDLSSGAGSLARAAPPRIEGPRADGHTFYVADTASALARFNVLVGTPVTVGGSATDAGVASLTLVTETLVFRDSGATGPIFTTCVVSDSIAAARSGM